MAQAKAPSQLPKETAPPTDSVANEPNRDDDGFIQQEVASDKPRKGPFLVGKSDIGTDRIITRENFRSVGIDQDTLTFLWEDDFKLPTQGINPAAVEFLAANEYGFSVVDE